MILVVANEKGGTGKTTVATNLAVWRSLQGRDVLLVDADPQRSAAEFAAVRCEEKVDPTISCASITGRTLAGEVRKMAGRFDDVVIDVGGRDSAGFRSALLVADVLLVPLLPGQLDVWAVEAVDGLVGEAMVLNEGLRGYTLINKVDSNPRVGLAGEAAEFCQGLEYLGGLDVRLGYRVAYRRAVAEGRAVCELDRRDPKAIAEIEALARVIYGDA